MTRSKFVVLVTAICFSSCYLMAHNSELTQADEYFSDRQNITSLKQAKKLYQNIIKKSKNNPEKIHAFDRFARLSVLEGQLAPQIWGSSPKDAAQIFDTCIDLSNKISRESLGYEVPEYIYWRAVCIGLWANHSSVFTVTFKSYLIFEMVNLIKLGMQKYSDFDEGGFYLLEAGLKIRSRSFKIIGVYEPQEAIVLLEKAQELAFDNFTSYLLKAEAEQALSQKNEAQATLIDGIDKLEAKLAQQNINTLLKVESHATLALLKESLKNLTTNKK